MFFRLMLWLKIVFGSNSGKIRKHWKRPFFLPRFTPIKVNNRKFIYFYIYCFENSFGRRKFLQKKQSLTKEKFYSLSGNLSEFSSRLRHDVRSTVDKWREKTSHDVEKSSLDLTDTAVYPLVQIGPVGI